MSVMDLVRDPKRYAIRKFVPELDDYLGLWDGNNAQRMAGGLPPFYGFRRDDRRPLWSIAEAHEAVKDRAVPMPIHGAADGIFYRDTRIPTPIIADETATTLSTTMLALFPVARTVLPANYWRAGKALKLTAGGKLTTDGTAGNYVFEMGYGTGNAPATNAQGATVAGTVSQTNIFWTAWGIIECRSAPSTTATLFRLWGQWSPAVAVLASTLQPYTFPAATPADATAADTTIGTNFPSFQLQRSGAGVWTATVTNLICEALN